MSERTSKWSKHRFDEMAVMVKDKIDNPAEADVDRYVGLEHLDPESLKIRRWGLPTDVEATKLCFKAGDIIFGRRRVYQRKLAVADFDGICSAHAMVLRAKPKTVLPEFLPFFMQSDLFMERALEISVGSLSPTINWKTLAKQEFAVPPLDEQRRIAEVLQAAESAKQAAQKMVGASDAAQAALTEWFIQENCADTALDGLLESTAYGTSQRASDEAKGLPVLRIPNVLRGSITFEDLKWIEMNEVEQERYCVDDGDVLIVRTNGNPDYVGRCVVARHLPRTFVYASYLIRIRTRPDRLIPEFLVAMLNSPSIRRTMRGEIRSSAGNYNLNTKGIRSQKIPLPTLSEQAEFVRLHTGIGVATELIMGRLGKLQDFQRSLLGSLGS